ncbi:TRAP transporter substrate-binding protein DctP [Rhizobium sp. NRK18]|uniref:TRAP transporter substrate-binding protein DctP n=1 Tax=Rhizobium sp. NRK18 TaxID=2964667 RepID=UPI0021C3C2CC|nr:TRAP transporter substrate-binding protein DctP [Rhizobium sp. NRK18]MCQ2006318.1 TRAP transporter substrate-binding protein DctP [Rhizobium sp. NRK18]
MKFLTVLTAAGLLAGLSTSAMSDDFTLKVTLDTSPQHVRNVWLKEFAAKIEEASQGRLHLTILEAASAFKDVEAAAAVAQGSIDMAIPQYQLISKFVPDADLEQLPMFYGAPREKIYDVIDGDVGKELNAKIEDKLGVTVIGRPIDLGFGTVFSTTTELHSPLDLRGLKVRVPGGPATIKRYEIMGAAPVQVAWPDVPQALQTGTISALWTTQESLASAKLWDAGVKYGLDDRQAIVQYVPLMNTSAWQALPEELRSLFQQTWDGMVDAQRDTAHQRQDEARALNTKNGIASVEPSDADLATMRNKLLEAQPELVDTLGMDPDLVAKARKILVQ